MKFHNKTTEAAALALACAAVDVGCGVAIRLVDGHWPSLGFWLSGVVVYIAVVLPTIRRWRQQVNGGSQT